MFVCLHMFTTGFRDSRMERCHLKANLVLGALNFNNGRKCWKNQQCYWWRPSSNYWWIMWGVGIIMKFDSVSYPKIWTCEGLLPNLSLQRCAAQRQKHSKHINSILQKERKATGFSPLVTVLLQLSNNFRDGRDFAIFGKHVLPELRAILFEWLV